MVVYTHWHYGCPKLDLSTAGYIESVQKGKELRKPIQILYNKNGILIFKGSDKLFDYLIEAYFVATIYQEEDSNWYFDNLFMLTAGDTEIEWFGVKMQVNYMKHLKGSLNSKLFKSFKIENKTVKLATTASGLKNHTRVIAFPNTIATTEDDRSIKLSLAKGLDRYIIVGHKLFENPVVKVMPHNRMFAIIDDIAVFFDSGMVAEEYKVIQQTEEYVCLENGIYDYNGMPIAVWDLDPKGVKIELEGEIVAHVSHLVMLKKVLGITKINDIPVDKPKKVSPFKADSFKGIPSKDRQIIVTENGLAVFHKGKPEYLIRDGRRYKAVNNPPLKNAIYVIKKDQEMIIFREIKTDIIKRERLDLPYAILKRLPFWLTELEF